MNPYAYALNDPVNLSDPSGKFIWDLIDVGFFGWSLQQFIDCPSWGNAGSLALDTISLIPVIPSIGYITHADDAANAINKGTNLWPGPGSGRQIINGIEYTTHALERMEPVGLGGRGIPPSVVENAIKYGKKTVGETGEIIHDFENVTVVTNETLNKVITVIKTGN